MAFARYFSLLTLGTLLANAKIGPVGDLVIDSTSVNPDGFLLPRTAIQANGKIDGDLIVGNKGDTMRINVINNLHDNSMLQSTSIHWHGFFQRNGTNWADGPAFVNQCPIAKGHSFEYEFSTGDQAGTFWYHSHLSTQYCDGLRGPLVIYDPNDPHKDLYDVDDETTVVTLADWYHLKAKLIIIGISDTTLINGKGRYIGGGELAPLSVITVTQGKRYRLRFVSLACDPTFTVSIDGHTDLTIIESDSISTQPLVVDQFDIFPAQRYSVILNANQPVNNYFIRANPSLGVNQGFLLGVNTAILRYVGAPATDPTQLLPPVSTNKLNEADLVPLENPGAPGTPSLGSADKKFNLLITGGVDGIEVNGVAYRTPTVPVLLQLLSGSKTPDQLLPAGSIYRVNRGDVVEVSIPGGSFAGPHPIHLHGHAFDLIRASGSSTYNFVNPPRRDVASAGNQGDNMTFRFKADNPGPWIMHCHIDWHLELGLAIVFAEAPDQWTSTIDPPDSWDELCPIYDALPASDL